MTPLEDDPERGSAVVEFLGVALLLLVPLVYLVLVLGEAQAAVFAAEGAARDAGRIVAQASDPHDAELLAARAVEIAFADQGIEVDGDAALRISCQDECLAAGSTVLVEVDATVPLPLVPSWLRSAVPLEVPVSAQAWTAVDQYRER
ncbi:TadE family protein [Beutenbergia cavernae DSM 12333]|uniref:TadE family protein n=1 Tax=Beutenbergia cavernae (strain ATCC BAA-8 / DSM 12333 / CCUG 43141 / JCM 11478 / NBRC 16432 / NCIMB 13614 / HKI 0122) TaxID=471853 RepID=C5BYD1_BEUC1|nr:hypothetical protein [Beutenbergia cavernae]ACQ81031.1 TadE family protein [Beutenbergia cavernae DSM 12333]